MIMPNTNCYCRYYTTYFNTTNINHNKQETLTQDHPVPWWYVTVVLSCFTQASLHKTRGQMSSSARISCLEKERNEIQGEDLACQLTLTNISGVLLLGHTFRRSSGTGVVMAGAANYSWVLFVKEVAQWCVLSILLCIYFYM